MVLLNEPKKNKLLQRYLTDTLIALTFHSYPRHKDILCIEIIILLKYDAQWKSVIVPKMFNDVVFCKHKSLNK